MGSRMHSRRDAPMPRSGPNPRHRTRMPRPKPLAFTGTAELNAMIGRVAPAILGLLADGVPRTKAAIVAALAGRHTAEDVALTLVRLAVTGRQVHAGRRRAARGRLTRDPGEGAREDGPQG